MTPLRPDPGDYAAGDLLEVCRHVAMSHRLHRVEATLTDIVRPQRADTSREGRAEA
ncbi:MULTISPECIES: hypothetical protein [unclassified Kitasatospora]